MAKEDSSPCGFDRWKKTNKSGTLEEYLRVLKEHESKKKQIPPPNGMWLPGGVFVKMEGVSPSEFQNMAKDFTKESGGQQ